MAIHVVFPTPFHSVQIEKQKIEIYEPITSFDTENRHPVVKELINCDMAFLSCISFFVWYLVSPYDTNIVLISLVSTCCNFRSTNI